VYVRLAVAWADPTGAVHRAGEFVDVDVVTLAELEEQGVVENPEEVGKPEWWGPGKVGDEAEGQVAATDEIEASDDPGSAEESIIEDEG
jgi:hypothetical protein